MDSTFKVSLPRAPFNVNDQHFYHTDNIHSVLAIDEICMKMKTNCCKNLVMISPERTVKAFVKTTIEVNWSVHGRNLKDEKGEHVKHECSTVQLWY